MQLLRWQHMPIPAQRSYLRIWSSKKEIPFGERRKRKKYYCQRKWMPPLANTVLDAQVLCWLTNREWEADKWDSAVLRRATSGDFIKCKVLFKKASKTWTPGSHWETPAPVFGCSYIGYHIITDLRIHLATVLHQILSSGYSFAPYTINSSMNILPLGTCHLIVNRKQR